MKMIASYLLRLITNYAEGFIDIQLRLPLVININVAVSHEETLTVLV